MRGSNKQKTKRSLVPIVLLTLAGTFAFGLLLSYLLRDADIALLNPKGVVANEQAWLLVVSTLIMLGFGVPVILTLYFFAWKYRADNGKTDYVTRNTESKAMLAFAWGGPLVIVIILAAIMLPATQRLEPQKPIESSKEQITIQVVSLNWKWLFIYPEHGVAAVNFTQIPVDTPIRYELTADGAPMSSFWVPHLAGMLYVMTGHVNPLHLMADTIGDYPGSSAEINGWGFAGMKFTTRVSSQADFDAWIAEAKQSPHVLDKATYEEFRKESENNPVVIYKDSDPTLYKSIVDKYGGHEHHEGHGSY